MKMMDKKATGSFSKVGKLITVLKKSNGKAVIGDSGALISPKAAKYLVYGGLVILTALLCLGVYLIQPYAAWLITAKGLAQALMLVFLLLSFVLAIKDIVTVLYTADDLELLLPMPFSAEQIVVAKLAVASAFPVILSLVLMNSVCLGFGIREGCGAAFVIGIILSSILIPVTGISAATLLVVIIFRLFGFIRNRDITVALGGIFSFGLTFAYIIFYNRFSSEGSGEKAAAAFHALSAVSAVFPNISFMNRFMFEGNVAALVISLAFTLVIIMLAALAVKAFYFRTALSMQNTAAKNKALSEASLRGGKKNDTLAALTAYEAKSSRRNPAYMIYGFAISLFWPLLLILPFVLGNNSLLSGITYPLDTIPALLCSITFAITASCLACGFNILPGTAFSREGSCFAAIRALPVDLTDYYKSKRNFSMLVCSLGSVLYVMIVGIVGVAAGIIPIASGWTILVGAAVSFLLNLIWINLMLLKNSRKPRFNWDSETELSRKLGGINLIAILIGMVSFIAFFVYILILPMLNKPAIMRTTLIICAAIVLLILVLASVVNTLALRTATKNLMKLE